MVPGRATAIFAKRPHFWAFVLLCLLGIAAYGHSLGNSFIWDDEWLIVRNPWLREWHLLPRLLTADLFHFAMQETDVSAGYYRPLQSLSYFIDYAFWGLNPFGYHALNLFLHVLNAYLLFSFARRFICPPGAALLAACLFLVHPVQTEAVTYLPSRGTLLASTACLFALRCFAEFRRSVEPRAKKRWYATALAGFGLGLFSAEWSAGFPLLLAVYDRFDSARGPNRFRKGRLARVVPFIGLSAAYFSVRAMLPGISVSWAALAQDSRPWIVRLAAAFQAVIVYLRLLAAPKELYFDRILATPVFSSMHTLFALLAVPAFFFAAWRMAVRGLPEGFCLLWFLVGLLPFSNGWAVIGWHLHEHWLYFPSAGFLLFVAQSALFLDAWLKKKAVLAARSILIGLAAVGFAHAVSLTIRRNAEYAEPAVFYAAELKSAPYNVRAASNLGLLYQQQGNVEGAIALWRQALRFRPDLCFARANLAMAMHQKGQTEQAMQMLNETLLMKPSCVTAMVSLGTLLFDRGDTEAAVRLWKRAVAIQPGQPEAVHNLRLTGASVGHP